MQLFDNVNCSATNICELITRVNLRVMEPLFGDVRLLKCMFVYIPLKIEVFTLKSVNNRKTKHCRRICSSSLRRMFHLIVAVWLRSFCSCCCFIHLSLSQSFCRRQKETSFIPTNHDRSVISRKPQAFYGPITAVLSSPGSHRWYSPLPGRWRCLCYFPTPA